MLRAAFFHGFPFTDIPQAVASVVVTTNDDQDLALTTAQRIASEVWDCRDEFRLESLTPEIAIPQAIRVAAERGGPVVVNDTADNPGGGTPGDATHVLRALIEAAPDRACFGFVYDPTSPSKPTKPGPGQRST